MAKPLKKNAKTQYFATISANLLMMGFGCGVGWLSMALPLLQSEKSPLKTGALNVEEISWIGSIISLGALIGNILLGYVVTFIGSRNSILLIGFPQLASWLFMMFGTCPIHLVISRFLTGLVVGGAQVCTSLYTAEIADNEIRGQLGTIYQYSRNFGILFAYTLGSYFDYIVSSIFFSGITILFIVTFMLVPSTPQYLLQKNKQKAAEKAFKFYNKHQLDTKDKDSSNQFEGMKLVAKGVEEDPRIALKDINEARYAIIQATIFALLTSLSGQFIFLTYGSSTIENAGTNLSPELSSICMALFQIMATFVAFILIDRKGRKMLLVLSMLGCALGHAILIGYLFLHSYGIDTSMFHWTPIICMSSVVFSASIGITPLTLICMVEIFPTKTRSFGLTFGTVVMNIFSFFINKAYPILMQIIDLQGCLIIFCVSCTLGTIFALVFVEETKGKDLNEKVEPMSSRRESFVTM